MLMVPCTCVRCHFLMHTAATCAVGKQARHPSAALELTWHLASMPLAFFLWAPDRCAIGM